MKKQQARKKVIDYFKNNSIQYKLLNEEEKTKSSKNNKLSEYAFEI